jgi:type VI secretion system ImpC/EvpB family protein
MLQYVMCASRFAHYLKVLARNKMGDLSSSEELENFLNRWLSQYVSPDEKAGPATKARYPLLDGRVEVRDTPGSPGSFRLIMHLLPHYQLDRLSASLRLTTRLTTSQGA